MLVISQPTYLPWIGYFSLINEAKKFVFLDDVQLNSRSWQQRNRILNHNKITYLTVPIKKKGQREQLINQSLIDDKTIFKKHLKIINHFYSKSKFFKEYFNHFEEMLIECEKFEYLSDVNIFLIQKICKLLKISLNYNLSSKIKSTGKKTDKLISICKLLHQNRYLTNEGAMVYLDSELNKFKDNKIELYKLFVNDIRYNQRSEFFKEKLSIVDVIFNEGPNAINIIKNSYNIQKTI